MKPRLAASVFYAIEGFEGVARLRMHGYLKNVVDIYSELRNTKNGFPGLQSCSDVLITQKPRTKLDNMRSTQISNQAKDREDKRDRETQKSRWSAQDGSILNNATWGRHVEERVVQSVS